MKINSSLTSYISKIFSSRIKITARSESADADQVAPIERRNNVAGAAPQRCRK
jgi:hypothetical protein